MTEFRMCRYCGKNSTMHPNLAWNSRNQCRPCNWARMNPNPESRAWRQARDRARKKLGSAKLIPESLGDKDAFRGHIEKQFYSPHMTWETWGAGRGKWQIDHILPVSDFNPEIHDVETYFGLDNLQPLWYRHNMAKSNLEPDAVLLAIDADRLVWAVEDLPAERRDKFARAARRLLDETHRNIENAIRITREELDK